MNEIAFYEQFKNATQDDLNDFLIQACQNGNLDIVQYLLTSTELPKHANIHANEDWALRTSCNNGHLDVVKYLLSSPDLKKHADIHTRDDYAFRVSYSKEHLKILQYFIFEF